MNQRDIDTAARSLRLIVEKTARGEDSLREAQLKDRLLLAADVLDAVRGSSKTA
jgi:hypothetical protein